MVTGIVPQILGKVYTNLRGPDEARRRADEDIGPYAGDPALVGADVPIGPGGGLDIFEDIV